MATQPDDNWWQSAPVVAPANDPGFSGFIQGAPKQPPLPSGYEADPNNPGRIMPIPGGPNDPTPPPSQTSNLSGDAYLNTLDQPTAAMVKALAEGRKAFPSGSALRAPYWQDMLAKVSNYDPGFDETNYQSRAATRKDFSIGTAGKNIRALNTAIGHLGQLYDQIPDTASHQFSVAGIPLPGATAANAIENIYLTSSGDPGPGRFSSTVTALAGELTQVYRNAGGAEADIQRYINELSPNQSEAQKKATIQNIVGLLNSRLNALQDQYQKGMGVGAQGYQFLDPQADKTLQMINSGANPPNDNNTPGAGGDNGGGGSGSGGDLPPGMRALSPAQQSQEKAFLQTKPTPEQYANFLGALQGGGTVDVAAAKKRRDALNNGAEYNPNIDNTAAIRQRIAQEDKLGLKTDPTTTLALQGGTLNLSDEAAGIGNAAANILTSPFTGKFDPVGAYDLGRDVERQRIADARQQLGYGAPVVEFAGGMAALSPSNALAAVADAPSIAQAAKGGAAAGALSGYGQGEGTSQSLTGAAVGAGGGAAVGALAPYAVDRIAAARAPQGMAPDLANAAQAEGVDLIRPMVDPASRGKFGELESNPVSQNTIRQGVDRVKGQIADRVAALGDGGTALEQGAAGERYQLAGNRYIQRSRGIKDRLYNAAENAAGEARFVPQSAIDQLNADISQLQANPKSNAATIQFLQDKVSDLSTPGGKTVAEIRNIREGLRGEISQKNLTMTNAERLANNALQAAGDDIAQANPEAARLYKRADAFYRDRQVVVDDIKRSILGPPDNPLDPQTTMQNIKRLAAPGGNLRRLSSVSRYLEPDERADIAATVAEGLGRDAPDMPFSANKFISQTNKISPAAQRVIFGEGGAQSIQNLRTLSQALKEAGGDVNYGRSGSNVIRYMAKNFIGRITGLGAAGGAGFMAGGAEGAAAGALGAAGMASIGAGKTLLSARAMVNPRVSAWLAQAADVSTPSQAKQAVRGLSLVISREPALARELTPIRDFLDQRVTQLLAAQPDNQNQQQSR
jgi:hypothetical protein